MHYSCYAQPRVPGPRYGPRCRDEVTMKMQRNSGVREKAESTILAILDILLYMTMENSLWRMPTPLGYPRRCFIVASINWNITS